MQESFEIFSGNVVDMMDRADVRKIDEVDIIICPLLISRHFYMVCFNLNDLTIELIDNSADGGKTIQRYKGVPSKLVKTHRKILKNKL